ncbi:MAG: hypothetical protein VX265_13350 [Myxococcota bacterium]|nr:hypothetical protein [Myxococcota bacterium]
MVRHPLLIALVLGVGVCFGCGGGTEYFVEREGQQEVIGTQNPADARRPAARSTDAGASRSARRGGLQPSQSRTVDDHVTPGLLPPVLERYDVIAERGHLLPEDCPDGTEFVDERKDRSLSQFCILPADGVRHGPSIRWFGTNRIKDVGPYQAGKRNGWWTQWKRDGTRSGSWLYANGDPIRGEDAESP